MLSRYKAVFFDVGGTLIQVEPSVGEVYATYARPFGFIGSGAELDRRFRKRLGLAEDNPQWRRPRQ